MSAHLPLLVADLPDEASAARLLAVARASGEAWVPLLAPPAKGGLHALELVHPGATVPVRVGATPLGPRGPKGVPLRLSVLEGETLEGRALAGGAFVVGALVERAETHVLHHGRHRAGNESLVVRFAARELACDAHARERFLAEARAAEAVDHPNLVRVVASGEEPDGLLWVASEHPDGQTLRERLVADGPLTAARLAPLALQVCAGLDAAHRAGLVHRDLRPENVVLTVIIDRAVTPRVVAKVRELGFGLGGRLASGRLAAGPPEYMSPEACRGDDLDARSDVYALGILLYELVTGQVPFASDRPIVVVNRHLGMMPVPPSEVRPDLDWRLDDLLGRALRKLPHERHRSMEELAAEIAALRTSAGPRPRPVSDAPAAPMPGVSLPPAARASSRPDWLEDAGASHSKFLEALRTSAAVTDDTRVSLRRDAKAYAAKLVALTDPRAFEAEVRALGPALATLLDEGDTRALWAVSSALDGIATEEKGNPPTGTRAFVAARALAWFHDPSLLAMSSERRLATGDLAAHTLLVRAGARGAHALYGARVRVAASAPSRARFVETLREIGASAWPVIKAALERMPDAALEGRHAQGVELAEDLLASLPTLSDGDDAEVLARYLRARVPSLAEEAARGFARTAPSRAGPRLLALLDDPREGVRAAAVAGLRELGAVDGSVVEKLAPIVRREIPATPALRLAAIAALRAVVEEARPLAAPLLAGIVRSSPRGEDRIVHAAAEALLAMLGNQARSVVLDRMDRSEEPLRSALAELLANPTLEL